MSLPYYISATIVELSILVKFSVEISKVRFAVTIFERNYLDDYWSVLRQILEIAAAGSQL